VVLEEVVLEEAFDDWYTDLEVAHVAFHQGNCCFHILDSVAVDAAVDKDAFAAQRYVFFLLLELTNAVDYTK